MSRITDVDFISNDRVSRRISKARKRLNQKAEETERRLVSAAKLKKSLPLAPKTATQEKLFEMINTRDLVLADGVAGVGKSYIAARMGLQKVLDGEFEKLTITRPMLAMENESIGFLPGGINEKIQPWCLPIISAFTDTLRDKGEVQKLIDIGKIELLAMCFAQGLSFRNTFFICDETQNATPEQFRVLVTRIGDGSKAIFLGDTTSSALRGKLNGFEYAIDVLLKYNLPDGLVEFDSDDVVRSDLVKRWVQAFENDSDSLDDVSE